MTTYHISGPVIPIIFVYPRMTTCINITLDALLSFRYDSCQHDTSRRNSLTYSLVLQPHQILSRSRKHTTHPCREGWTQNPVMGYDFHDRTIVRPRQCLEISCGAVHALDLNVIMTNMVVSKLRIPPIDTTLNEARTIYLVENLFLSKKRDIYTNDDYIDEYFNEFTNDDGMQIEIYDNVYYTTPIATTLNEARTMYLAYCLLLTKKRDIYTNDDYMNVYFNEFINDDEMQFVIYVNVYYISSACTYSQNTTSLYMACDEQHVHGDSYDTGLGIVLTQRGVACCGSIHNSFAGSELWRDWLSPMSCLTNGLTTALSGVGIVPVEMVFPEYHPYYTGFLFILLVILM